MTWIGGLQTVYISTRPEQNMCIETSPPKRNALRELYAICDLITWHGSRN
jgi:hypothetical protein